MFKSGDYVMGKDRSYARSLYQVIEVVNATHFKIRFIILGGMVGKGTDDEVGLRRMQEFGLASAIDIKIAFGYEALKKFFKILNKLELTKSSQVQRSFGLRDFLQ